MKEKRNIITFAVSTRLQLMLVGEKKARKDNKKWLMKWMFDFRTCSALNFKHTKRKEPHFPRVSAEDLISPLWQPTLRATTLKWVIMLFLVESTSEPNTPPPPPTRPPSRLTQDKTTTQHLFGSSRRHPSNVAGRVRGENTAGLRKTDGAPSILPRLLCAALLDLSFKCFSWEGHGRRRRWPDSRPT